MMSEPAQTRQPTVVAVVGPTATGKTAISAQLAQALGGEVISADSQLVYRGLDIGTAKPTEAETQGIPHHMIDRVEPTEAYSVAQYQEAASGILRARLAEGKPVIVTGGTGFYLRALLQESFIPDIPPDPTFREHLQALAAEKGRPHLHELLRQKDPRRAGQLHPNDLVRVIRALEIIEQTGAPVPDNRSGTGLDVRWIGLGVESRDWLRARIDARIDAMLAGGWETEVEHLIKTYGPEAHALRVAHGYPELVELLQGRRSRKSAIEQIRINIHQYATRQFTWFNRNPQVNWLQVDVSNPGTLYREALRLAGM